MLNPETKRRIDACRDILVGKIPDPKAQVEQITTALIYKFMDDMDAESESLGGKPSFFIDKYKRFSWSKLLSKQLAGQERMDLYIQATTAFGTAEHLPKLFRDIFVDAFLPYRDPETLNLFLKEVDGFLYEHSEDLGDAFEYLLSILGSQGDAGQFRTPRHIIEFIVDCVDPDINDSILDPACGTAGFLISAYRHIIEKYDGKDADGKKNNERRLTKPERERLIKNIQGYDISPDMVRISRVNMYLHGFPVPKIVEYDTLTSEERWGDSFDVILANPPFMTPKGGIRPHSKFSLQANRSEVLFSDYIMEHLKPSGRAGFIVPEGIIFQSGNAYKELRKRLVEDHGLVAVVSLPAGVFQPYSGVKTSILLLDRALAKEREDVLFIKIENDGYDIGSQRRPTPDKNDLPKAIETFKAWKQSTALSTQHTALAVPRTKIAESGDYNLSMDRYRETVVKGKQKWDMVKLGDVAQYINGFPFKPSDWEDKGKPIIRIQNLTGTSTEYNYSSRQDIPEKYFISKGDLLISWSASIGFYIWDGVDALLNQHIFKAIPNERIKKEYLYFLGDVIVDRIKENVHGNTMQHITKGKFDNIQIPLPPLSVQEELVAELERLRMMAEGARTIIANYKPEIDINPDWEMVELGEVIKILTDFTANGSFAGLKANVDYQRTPDYALLVRLTDLRTGLKNTDQVFVSKKSYDFLKKSSLVGGEFLLANVGANIGDAYIMPTIDKPATLGPNMFLLKFLDNVLPPYIYYLNESGFLKDRIVLRSQSAAQPKINKSELRSIQIPLPPLSEQETIVRRLESERAEIEMLKGMVARLEGEIKRKVAEVW